MKELRVRIRREDLLDIGVTEAQLSQVKQAGILREVRGGGTMPLLEGEITIVRALVGKLTGVERMALEDALRWLEHARLQGEHFREGKMPPVTGILDAFD